MRCEPQLNCVRSVEDALRQTLRKLPGSVHRAKGVVYSTDAPERRAVPQVVGRRVDIAIQEEWGQRRPRTQIVAIGAAGGIDANLLEKTSASCISVAAARFSAPTKSVGASSISDDGLN